MSTLDNAKIATLDELGQIADKYRDAGKTVVLCHGMFDLVHLGHIRHLQAAKQAGDILMVTTTTDDYSRKGPDRPVFSQDLRLESLAALEVVDHVAVCPYPTAVEAIQVIRPDVYAKGKEYEAAEDDLTGMIAREREAVERQGGRIFFTDDLTFSSSSLLNAHFGVFSPETKNYLEELRAQASIETIFEQMNRLNKTKVLVVGESIIDRYTFTSQLGQSGKGIYLAVRYNRSEEYAGGAIAVANHAAAFSDHVTLFSGLGRNRSGKGDYEPFIRENLHSNVTAKFFRSENMQTIVKERFVDHELTKFFEVYFGAEAPIASKADDDEVCAWLEQHVPEYDVVIVPDYGNGFITERMVQTLSTHARFLAVNTQINSGNRGYHVVDRYPRADFISLNEPELRLACHDRHASVEALARATADRLNAATISITQGSLGLFTFDRGTGRGFRIPALSTRVVDRVGAGDAYLSMAALSMGSGLTPQIGAFIGAAAAALNVQIIGNRETIDRVNLQKFITTILR